MLFIYYFLFFVPSFCVHSMFSPLIFVTHSFPWFFHTKQSTKFHWCFQTRNHRFHLLSMSFYQTSDFHMIYNVIFFVFCIFPFSRFFFYSLLLHLVFIEWASGLLAHVYVCVCENLYTYINSKVARKMAEIHIESDFLYAFRFYSAMLDYAAHPQIGVSKIHFIRSRFLVFIWI